MPARTSLRVLVLAGVASASLLVGCGSSSSSANKSTFCTDNAALNNINANPTSAADALNLLKQHKPQIDKLQSEAPSAIKSSVDLLVNAINKAISTGDPSGLQAQNLTDAGNKIDSYCGTSA